MATDGTIEWFEGKHWIVKAMFVCFGIFTCLTAMLIMIPPTNGMSLFIVNTYGYFSLAGFIVSAPIFQHYQKPVKVTKGKH
jgi:hypothetical protein